MKPPWIARSEEEIKCFDITLTKEFGSKIKKIKKYPLSQITKRALIHKKYDIYHSTTIEGYRITPEEVEAVIYGPAKAGMPPKKASVGELRNKMAILGHAHAFDFVISKIQNDFPRPELSEDLVREIYFQLFKPSADAEIIDKFDLIGYRKTQVFIRGTRYVPPSNEKIENLMKNYAALIGKIKNVIIKAVLAHYFLVTIHPFVDGNGRCARLLMNYLLAASGYHWITISIDKRDIYFQTLTKAQVEHDIIPFGKFILGLMTKNGKESI